MKKPYYDEIITNASFLKKIIKNLVLAQQTYIDDDNIVNIKLTNKQVNTLLTLVSQIEIALSNLHETQIH